MSASKAAELTVHHAQAAAYHQGLEKAYGEAMRLVRQVKQRAPSLPMADVIAILERTELALYDLAQEDQRRKDRHNRVLREVAETFGAASN